MRMLGIKEIVPFRGPKTSICQPGIWAYLTDSDPIAFVSPCPVNDRTYFAMGRTNKLKVAGRHRGNFHDLTLIPPLGEMPTF